MILLALSLLLSGAHAAKLDAVCAWKKVRWDHSAALLLPGTDTPLAQLGYDSDASLDAELGYDALGDLRMRAAFDTDEFEVSGELRYNDGRLLRLAGDHVPLGQAGTLLSGGELRVAAVSDGRLIIGASDLALDGLDLWDAHAVVDCDQLSLHYTQLPWLDHELLELAGISGGAPSVLVRRSPLRPAPDRRAIGRVSLVDGPRDVSLIEERGAWSLIAQPHWTGVVWQGWVRTKALRPADEETESLAGIGMMGIGKPETVRRCEEDIDLAAEVNGEVHPFGVVKAGVPIMVFEGEPVSGADETWVEAGFYRGWVQPAEGGRLLVEADVLACEVGPVELPPEEPVEGLESEAPVDDPEGTPEP